MNIGLCSSSLLYVNNLLYWLEGEVVVLHHNVRFLISFLESLSLLIWPRTVISLAHVKIQLELCLATQSRVCTELGKEVRIVCGTPLIKANARQG